MEESLSTYGVKDGCKLMMIGKRVRSLKNVSSVSLHTVKVLFLCTDFANEVDTYSNFIKY